MNPIKKLLLKHLFTWLGLSLIYFVYSETITKKLFPGFDNVTLWLVVTVAGLILILTAVSISFLVKMIRVKKLLQIKKP